MSKSGQYLKPLGLDNHGMGSIFEETEAAYARPDLFERQRVLMDQWAAYLSQASDKVVPLVRRR